MPDPDSPSVPEANGRPTRRRLLGLAGIGTAAALVPALAGCGFRPVHRGPGGGTRDPLPAIDIPVIEERAGQLLRNALLDRLPYDPKARYELKVALNVSPQGLGIQRDDEASLQRLNGVAHFTLVDRTARPVGDEARVPALLEGSVRRSALYNVFETGYASEASRRGATRDLAEVLADDLHARLMGYFAAGGGARAFPRL